jgi:hypothetical protein
MEVHVQFSDAAQTKIVAEFGCPQDPASYPHQASIDSGDARYQAFINPLPPPPSAVSMRQAQLALLDAGLFDAVVSAIESLPSPQRQRAEIEWRGSTVERSSPFVASMAVALGLDDAALDALFIEALAK